MIEFDKVGKTYPNGFNALKDVNLKIEQGEFVAIIGLSGAGKSTLLRTINRMHDITEGKLTVDGTDVMQLKGKELRRFRRKIGMIFQSFNLVTRTKVINNVLMQLETNLDAVERVSEYAAESGTRVILNPAPAADLPEGLWKRIDVITPNEVEAEYYTGISVCSEADAARAADWFHERGIGEVIITMADRGACLSSASGKREFVPAFSVEAVDTTGAGDAFCGGLLAAVSEGKDWKDAVVFASATAALSVQKIGTAPSMPDRREIEAFLENY